MITKCIENQDYPRDCIEWIIVDDGTDKIGDLVEHLPYVKYYAIDKKMVLGKKRNLMHSYCKGDYIVYMDDDDYYPPKRIKHAVKQLQKNPKYLIAGSSALFIYFNHLSEVWKFGPYRENHATAGTFAFKKELLEQTRYQEEKAIAEEKFFLKDYTIPLLQLDPKQVIMVFSHSQNTFDKKKLIAHGETNFVRKYNKKIESFDIDNSILNWFRSEMEPALEKYSQGRIENKPEVLKQTKEIENKLLNNSLSAITLKINGKNKRLTNKEIIELINKLSRDLNEQKNLNKLYKDKLVALKKENEELTSISGPVKE
jgi:glycosyltransferase involved in cell wall biosynthesis